MATRAPNTAPPDKAFLQTLARDLRADTSPTVILYHLKALGSLLHGSEGSIALFLKVGGLSILIHHLRGTATAGGPPDKGNTSCEISDAAAAGLLDLLYSVGAWKGLAFAASDVTALVNALGDAPSLMARSVAADALLAVVKKQPKEAQAIIDARVIMTVVVQFFVLYNDVDPPREGYAYIREFLDPTGHAGPGALLVRRLMCLGVGPAEQLRCVILQPHTLINFTGLLLIQEILRPGGDYILPALYKAGMLDALVTTLRHESPFCVAAAAGALAWVALNDGGIPMLEACGAISALVPVIDRRTPAPTTEEVEREMPIFQKAVFKITVMDRDIIHFNDPVAVAFGALASARAFAGALRIEFIKAGGVPVLVRILRESSCPLLLQKTVEFLAAMIEGPGPSQGKNARRELADMCFDLGFSLAVIQVLRKGPKDLCGKLLMMVSMFFLGLSPQHHDVAMAVLVSGGAVEHAVDYMVEKGSDMNEGVVDMLLTFLNYPQAKERLCAPATVNKLMKGTAKWLRKVDGPLLFQIPRLLNALLAHCRVFYPAAVNANLSPGLVRIMRKLRPGREATTTDAVQLNLINLPSHVSSSSRRRAKLPIPRRSGNPRSTTGSSR